MSYSDATTLGLFMATSFTASTTPTATFVSNHIIPMVDKYIDTITERHYDTSSSTTEYQDGCNSPYVFLNHPDIVTVYRVHEDTSGIGASPSWERRRQGRDQDFIVYDDEYGDHGYLLFHDDIPGNGYQNIRVIYSYGFSSTPDDIKLASTLLSAVQVLEIQSKDAKENNLDTFKVGDVTYKYDTARSQIKRFRAQAEAILDKRKEDSFIVM